MKNEIACDQIDSWLMKMCCKCARKNIKRPTKLVDFTIDFRIQNI